LKYVGIDQSKRSTAAVSLNDDGEMVGFTLISPSMDMDKEELIAYQWYELNNFLSVQACNSLLAIALEGAAFSAGGSSSDLLWGIQWFLRTSIYINYPEIPIGIITPASWRASIVHIEDQRTYKAMYGGKIGLKHAVKEKLPTSVLTAFVDYLEAYKNSINMAKGKEIGSRSKEYLKSIYDLADAWGIARHRWMIRNGQKSSKPMRFDDKPKLIRRAKT
jgi:hypothetical protein